MTAQDSHGTLLHMHGTRPTIEGCNGLTLTTDHNPLTSFSVQPTLSRRQARWSEFLSRFHYVVKYRPGALNPDDSLSRLLAPEEAVASLMVLAVTVSEFNSDLLSRLKAETLLDPHFTDEKCTRKYEHQGTYWTYQGRIDVPTAMQLEIIQEHHSNVVSGHFSWSRTLDLISRQLWWPQMRESVQSFVSSCVSCQRSKPSTKRPYGLLQPLEIPDSRWLTVTMDFIMDLPLTASGHNAIMVPSGQTDQVCPPGPHCHNLLRRGGVQVVPPTHLPVPRMKKAAGIGALPVLIPSFLLYHLCDVATESVPWPVILLAFTEWDPAWDGCPNILSGDTLETLWESS